MASEFELEVDNWVRDAMGAACTFREVVEALPGVYPKDVFASLRRLNIPLDIEPSELLLRLPGPIPHPVDGDWRFHPETVEQMVSLVARSVRAGSTIGLLGCSSLARSLAEAGHRVIVVDQNDAWRPYLLHGFYSGSIAFETVLGVAAEAYRNACDLVLLDPPWYPAETNQFLRAASAMARRGAIALMSAPAKGTRPGILGERADLLNGVPRLGFDLVDTDIRAIRYATPWHEGQALVAAGLPVLAGWRRSDLLMFERNRLENVAFGNPITSPWISANWGSLSLRIFPEERDGIGDARLISILGGDVFPTVSRRDPRRPAIRVWTAGNRVYGCRSTWRLRDIVASRPIESDLTYQQGASSDLILQLNRLEAVERQEYIALHEPETP